MPCKKPSPPSLELSAFCETVAVEKTDSHFLTIHNEDNVNCKVKLTCQCERHKLSPEWTRIYLHPIHAGNCL